jgi:Fur family ferric uptake transcriptional regulator
VKQSGEIVSKLSEQGYRLTPQRMMILSAIESSDGHISAEEIYAQVAAKYPHVNISTVYRTLELLKHLGLVIETDLGDGRLRYHSMEKGHHHHLVCTKCGAVIDVDESTLARLKDVLLHRYNFSAELRHVAIFGICGNCRK